MTIDCATASPLTESIQLLIVQPTPFCNIQCDYCYLPDRDSTAKMTPETFRIVLENVFASGLTKGQLSIVWHAGEPLALPIAYYQKLFAVIQDLGIQPDAIRHSMQTNGILLNDHWCDFLQQNNIHVGVSLDGPAFLHDRHRKDRSGKGTHSRAVEGIRHLQRREIDFHVITVVTADALAHADTIFDFFEDLGVRQLGFNVEEMEGTHGSSSLIQIGIEQQIRIFWTRLYERAKGTAGHVRIREFDQAYQSIARGPAELTAQQAMQKCSQVAPLGIVSVDCHGKLSSFSPELLGIKSLHYGDFIFGNVHESGLRDLIETAKFQKITADIYDGVRACENTCQYFALCGGGAPSNKYFENGTFASAETMYCRTAIQMPLEIVLQDLEVQLSTAAVA